MASPGERGQAGGRVLEDSHPLARREAHEGRVVVAAIRTDERGEGDRDDPRALGQCAAEGRRVGRAERCGIRHREVRPGGHGHIEPRTAQACAQEIALGAQRVGDPAKKASGRRSPVATAGWNGAPFTYVRYCLTASTASIRSAGPVTQPIFHPVVENVLPADEIVSVRSHAPGSVEIGTCGPSKTRCS